LGNLYFSLGENLGAAYRLIGSDGTTLSGGGEGGSIYRCKPDGTGLVRIATGFWNTFGLTFDAFDRLFAVDNDPDERGPCRLLHIVPGGDYGYRFRNGRKGLHPFTAWNGELPGTLPMVAGTGEAPCGVISYESTGLPPEYRGQLLVTSWGDHVVDHYVLRPRGASFASEPKALIRGGEDFRPVGIAVGPEGSLYLSDWVDKSYPVHGKGHIWRIRMKDPPKDDGLRASEIGEFKFVQIGDLLHHPKAEIRSAAASTLVRKSLRLETELAVLARDHDPRARMQALWAAASLPSQAATKLFLTALEDSAPEIRGQAVTLLGEALPKDPAHRKETHLLALATTDSSSFVRMQALLQLRTPLALKAIVPVLADPDPFLAGAATEVLGRPENVPILLEDETLHQAMRPADQSKRRLGILVALRRSGAEAGKSRIPYFLDDPDPEIRRSAIQWVAEEHFTPWVKLLDAAAGRPPVTRELFESLLAAKEILAGVQRKPVEESSGQEYIAHVVRDPAQPLPFRVLALQMLRPNHPVLTTEFLRGVLAGKSSELKREAVRVLAERSDPGSQALLRELARDRKADLGLRNWAILGLAHSATSRETQDLLLDLLREPAFARESLASLRGAAGKPEIARGLADWWQKAADNLKPEDKADLAAALLQNGKPLDQFSLLSSLTGPRPQSPAAWQALLATGGDPQAGERVFFHSRGPGCANCHRVDGRGGLIGPDLSTIGRALSRDRLIESILLPSKEIAPRYVSWLIVTHDGKTRTGVIVEEGPNSTVTIGDAQGKLETISRNAIEERRALPTSVMPANLPDLLTRREFQDLIAFLCARK
jgi:putative heme-binding domain-containing protein